MRGRRAIGDTAADMGGSGADAERDVRERLEQALPSPYACWFNVAWTGAAGAGDRNVDGEADVVIGHPDRGLLVLEVKAGIPSRDSRGRWWLGSRQLDRSPFEQAVASKHALARRLAQLPGWRVGSRPRAAHGVAFPHADRGSLGPGHVQLGADVAPALLLDARALEDPAATRAAIEAMYAHAGTEDSARDPLGPEGMRLLGELLAPTVAMRRLVRGRIVDDRAPLLAATGEQRRIIARSRRARRLEIAGPAGSGKSMLAAEQARRLAADGARTLLVCFNQPLATALRRDLADAPAPAGLEVLTFHRLCERMAAAAGVLPAQPAGDLAPWFDALPRALGEAMDRLPDERWDAVIVDEGQDFADDWLLLAQSLLRDEDAGVLWVFHDPGQALYRPDVVGTLGLERMDLFENHRNPPSIAALAQRFYRGGETVEGLRDEPAAGGPRHRVIEAAPGPATVEAVRVELHRLLREEEVRTWQVVVLTGGKAPDSLVWRRRTFGNHRLWNEAFTDEGTSRGLPPEEVPEHPSDAVLFETVRRFKGLEAEVVVLCELPEEAPRLDELLYVALTRATTELVVIAPPGLAARMR